MGSGPPAPRPERCHSYPQWQSQNPPGSKGSAPSAPRGRLACGRRATATSRPGPWPGSAAGVWLSAGWRAVVVARQLGGDTLAQRVEMAHQLGQGASGAHRRGLGAGRLEQGENLKLLGVVQSLGVAHQYLLPLVACVAGMIDQAARRAQTTRRAVGACGVDQVGSLDRSYVCGSLLIGPVAPSGRYEVPSFLPAGSNRAMHRARLDGMLIHVTLRLV